MQRREERQSEKRQFNRKLNKHTSFKDGQVRSVNRALTILNTLAEHDAGLTLKDLAPMVDLPAATIHRLLTTLQSEHYVYFDNESRLWSIGLQVHIIANSSDKHYKQAAPKVPPDNGAKYGGQTNSNAK